MNVGAICAERIWLRRSFLIWLQSDFVNDGAIRAERNNWRRRSGFLSECAFERRRHLRGAHMAPTFFLAVDESETNVAAICAPRRWRRRSNAHSQKKPKRRCHMRSAQMTSTFKCTVPILVSYARLPTDLLL